MGAALDRAQGLELGDGLDALLLAGGADALCRVSAGRVDALAGGLSLEAVVAGRAAVAEVRERIQRVAVVVAADGPLTLGKDLVELAVVAVAEVGAGLVGGFRAEADRLARVQT